MPKLPKKLKSKKPTKKEADKLFSLLIRKRGKCERCNSKFNLQCAHIISRRYFSTRFDIENAIPLCQRCHFFYTYHPIEWENWIINRIGNKRFQELKRKALSLKRIDYKELINELKRKLDEK